MPLRHVEECKWGNGEERVELVDKGRSDLVDSKIADFRMNLIKLDSITEAR